MAFVVSKLNLDDLNGRTGTFDHAATGITMTFRPFSDAKFQKAYNMLEIRQRADIEAIKQARLNNELLDNISEDDKTADELLVMAIAKFLIADWDLVDEEGKKLPVSADNFVLLLMQLPESQQIAIVAWAMDCAGKVSQAKVEKLTQTKKKPSSATRGKKTSAD